MVSPPVLVTAALVVVLLEAALWVAVGALWWLAINVTLLLALTVPVVWFVRWWRRTATQGIAVGSAATRGPGGRLTGRTAVGPGAGRSGSGGGRLGRLFGGSGKSGGSGRSSGAAGSGRRGGLGRLLSGGRRTGSGTAGRSGPGSSRSGSGRSGLRGLLSGSGRRSSTGRTGGGLRGLLGGRKATGGSGRSGGTTGRTGTAGGSRRGAAVGRMRSAGRGLLGRASGRPSSAKRSTPTGSPRRTNAAGKGPARLAGFFKGVREGAAGRKPSPKPTARPTPGRPAAGKSDGAPTGIPVSGGDVRCSWCGSRRDLRDTGVGIACPECLAAGKVDAFAKEMRAERVRMSSAEANSEARRRYGAEPKPSPHPRAMPKENRSMVQHSEDVSLQRWGRNLTTVGPALEEFAKTTDGHAQFAGELATAVGRLASQGEDELPAAKSVTAEAAAIAAELKQVEAEAAAAAGKLRSLAGRADALGASYRRNHETDEARLAGERGGRHKEKRADVGQAEQDT